MTFQCIYLYIVVCMYVCMSQGMKVLNNNDFIILSIKCYSFLIQAKILSIYSGMYQQKRASLTKSPINNINEFLIELDKNFLLFVFQSVPYQSLTEMTPRIRNCDEKL